jgi:hypothetical protein
MPKYMEWHVCAMFGMNLGELILILNIVAVVIGGTKLPGLGLGEPLRNYRPPAAPVGNGEALDPFGLAAAAGAAGAAGNLGAVGGLEASVVSGPRMTTPSSSSGRRSTSHTRPRERSDFSPKTLGQTIVTTAPCVADK